MVPNNNLHRPISNLRKLKLESSKSSVGKMSSLSQILATLATFIQSQLKWNIIFFSIQIWKIEHYYIHVLFTYKSQPFRIYCYLNILTYNTCSKVIFSITQENISVKQIVLEDLLCTKLSKVIVAFLVDKPFNHINS